MAGFTKHPFTPPGGPDGPWTAAGRVLLAAACVGSGFMMLAASPGAPTANLHAPTLVVDVNTVPVEVLSALPSVGPALAREIDARRAEAPFVSLADLARRTRGVGPATLARLARHLRTGREVAAGVPPRPGH